MIRRSRALIGSSTVLVGSVTMLTWAADISLDQIPEKARAVLEKLAGNNRIVQVESEKEGGVQVYEASWRVDGREVEAEVTADGQLLEMEEEVAAGEVPEAVRSAAETALPGATGIQYEKHTVVVWEVEGKVDGKVKEIKIRPTGQIVGQQKEEADDDDDEDED